MRLQIFFSRVAGKSLDWANSGTLFPAQQDNVDAVWGNGQLDLKKD